MCNFWCAGVSKLRCACSFIGTFAARDPRRGFRESCPDTRSRLSEKLGRYGFVLPTHAAHGWGTRPLLQSCCLRSFSASSEVVPFHKAIYATSSRVRSELSNVECAKRRLRELPDVPSSRGARKNRCDVLAIERKARATICLPAAFGVIGAERLLLAVADDANAIGTDAGSDEQLLSRSSAILPEREVVFV